MALIEPCYVPINFSQITLSSEKLVNESELIEASDKRVYAQILDMTGQYDTFSTSYQGDSSTTYVQAMQTFYGKAAKVSSIQRNCALSLFSLSLSSSGVNEEAFFSAFIGGMVK